MSHEYAFDLMLATALRVTADNETQARSKLTSLLDCASANLGAIDGNPVIAEVSLRGSLELYEVDGEPAESETPEIHAAASPLAAALREQVGFDIWYDAREYGDTEKEEQIEQLQGNIERAAIALNSIAALVRDLDALGFADPDDDVSGADCVDVINEHLGQLRQLIKGQS